MYSKTEQSIGGKTVKLWCNNATLGASYIQKRSVQVIYANKMDIIRARLTR